mgnify:CR=1 FL=1|tara:strand:+ start:76 stop:924 length:849 start_codon:yes stop_codon:yes gene_type:complete
MNKDKQSLGRGLDSLLGDGNKKKQQGAEEVELNLLSPGQFQPRRRMHKETLEELAQSIKRQGVIQPIVARQKASGALEIVVGERRWRAAQIAGLSTVPVIVRELNNEEAAKIALIENIQRDDLNPMDLARGLKRLQVEFNLSQGGLAEAIGKSRPTTTNLLRLNKLSPAVQNLLEQGRLDVGHARPLLSLDESEQLRIAEKIATEKMTARQVERLVTQKKEGRKGGNQPQKQDPNLTKLERDISEALGAKTQITQSKNGKGKLVINFNSLEALQGVLEKIKR